MLFSSNKKLSEEEIIRACQKGSEKHFKTIFENYYSQFFGICKRYADSDSEAEDYLQEGFLMIYKNIIKYNFLGSFEGWCKRVMVNVCLNNRRRIKKAQVLSIHSDFEYGEGEGLFVDKSMEDAIEKLNYKDLLASINQLSEAYKTIFNLFVIEGFSHKEIAEMLEINESTSRSNLIRARVKLQELITQKKKLSKQVSNEKREII